LLQCLLPVFLDRVSCDLDRLLQQVGRGVISVGVDRSDGVIEIMRRGLEGCLQDGIKQCRHDRLLAASA